ncbi:hypothetical protein AL025_14515 (plasmid) [Enterococcus faecium]|nr:hypothetical protein AL025_14515 [Enterococcus faecium]
MMGMFSQFILPLYLFCLYSLLLLYKSLTTKKLMHIKKMEKGLERIPIPKSASTFTGSILFDVGELHQHLFCIKKYRKDTLKSFRINLATNS